jgi:hypothetical protein
MRMLKGCVAQHSNRKAVGVACEACHPPQKEDRSLVLLLQLTRASRSPRASGVRGARGEPTPYVQLAALQAWPECTSTVR